MNSEITVVLAVFILAKEKGYLRNRDYGANCHDKSDSKKIRWALERRQLRMGFADRHAV
jgi:hypothetical protein